MELPIDSFFYIDTTNVLCVASNDLVTPIVPFNWYSFTNEVWVKNSPRMGYDINGISLVDFTGNAFIYTNISKSSYYVQSVPVVVVPPVVPPVYDNILSATNNNGAILSDILTFSKVLIYVLLIFVSWKLAVYVYKGLIMQTIRSYIKFKL